MSDRSNKRAYVSLLILMSFAVILTTSILMFVKKHNTTTALLHTIVGFALLCVVFFHLKNNLVAIKQYLGFYKSGSAKNGSEKSRSGNWYSQWTNEFNKPLWLTLLIVSSLVTLSYYQFQPFLSFYHWGNSLRMGDLTDRQNQLSYQIIDKSDYKSADKSTDKVEGVNNRKQISLELRAGRAFSWPQLAIWLETIDGEFLQPLFVSETVAKKGFVARINKKNDGRVFTENPFKADPNAFEKWFDFDEGKSDSDAIVRPESLPVFLHQMGERLQNRTFAEKPDEFIADAYSGATLNNHFLLKSKPISPLAQQFKIRLEVNQSFDFNAYYSSDRFPEDPVYSGNGFPAQPSLIYEAIIDSADQARVFSMQLLGHGHHSGQTGEIYADVSKHTTALEIIDRVIVEIN